MSSGNGLQQENVQTKDTSSDYSQKGIFTVLGWLSFIEIDEEICGF